MFAISSPDEFVVVHTRQIHIFYLLFALPILTNFLTLLQKQQAKVFSSQSGFIMRSTRTRMSKRRRTQSAEVQ